MAKEVLSTLPKSLFNQELKKKGDLGQDELKTWFDRNGFGYVAVCQAKMTFARLFAGDVKRPDFLLVMDGLGMIAVDAKYREPLKVGNVYSLPYIGEFKKAIMFERIFRLPVWYAYRGPQLGEWLWISALKAFEVGQLIGKGENSYLTLKPNDFVVIRSGDDFGQLYTQRQPGIRRLASRISRDLIKPPLKEDIEAVKKPASSHRTQAEPGVRASDPRQLNGKA